MAMLPPGSVIGILGGGQLGRMLAVAAARLGMKCHIYAPDESSPAFDVSAARTVRAYDDRDALAAFADAIDVATYEFENIPVETIAFLETRVPVRPGVKALSVTQDRLHEKKLAQRLGAATAQFAPVASYRDLQHALGAIAPPAILKTRRFGYDGKGQVRIDDLATAGNAFEQIGRQDAILESLVKFSIELSVVGARGLGGEFRAFALTENEHRSHILHRSTAPADVPTGVARCAIDIAQAIGDALDYVGVFAVEYFACPAAGGNLDLIVNEIAPRVHNSGHWTMDGAETSQFEQHIRAIAGWPLGSTTMTAPSAEMINLIGRDILDWQALAAEPGVFLHHYGKGDPRDGRKMGHVNRRLSAPRRPR